MNVALLLQLKRAEIFKMMVCKKSIDFLNADLTHEYPFSMQMEWKRQYLSNIIGLLCSGVFVNNFSKCVIMMK